MTQGSYVTTFMVKDIHDAQTIQAYLDGAHGNLSGATRKLLEYRLSLTEAQPAWPPLPPFLISDFL